MRLRARVRTSIGPMGFTGADIAIALKADISASALGDWYEGPGLPYVWTRVLGLGLGFIMSITGIALKIIDIPAF